jgi:hypothetical protein
MYTKRVEIPAVGEKKSLPSVEGQGLDVLRLDFLDSQDPLNNPRVRSDAGRIDQPLSERHPIRQDFRGLEIHNGKNAAAAGTLALLRVYEDAANILQTAPRKQPVIPAQKDLRYEELSAGGFLGTDEGGAFNDTVIPPGRSVSWRVRLTARLRDYVPPADIDALSSGFSEVHLELRFEQSITTRVGFFYTSIGLGEAKGKTLVRDLIVPPEEELTFSGIVDPKTGLTGEGNFSAVAEGYAFFDPTSQIPPK